MIVPFEVNGSFIRNFPGWPGRGVMAILVVLGVIFGTATGTGGLVPSLGHPAMASDDGDQPYDKNALCKQVLEWGEARGLTRTLAPEFEVMQGQELRIFVSLQGRPEYDSRLAEPYLDGLYCVLDALDLDYRQTLIPADANFSVVIKRVDPNSHIQIGPVNAFKRHLTPRWFTVEIGSDAYEQRKHMKECWDGVETVRFYGDECFPQILRTSLSRKGPLLDGRYLGESCYVDIFTNNLRYLVDYTVFTRAINEINEESKFFDSAACILSTYSFQLSNLNLPNEEKVFVREGAVRINLRDVDGENVRSFIIGYGEF